MNKILLLAVLFFISLTVKSQTTRYFEFKQPYNDDLTSFIVATSDTTVVNSVLYDITLPISQRRFISGNVINGSGGFNHNGANWYGWHFITDEWQLTPLNVEYCDGQSSLMETNPSIIAGDTVYFCPWNSYPFQEITNPELSVDQVAFESLISIHPNPASNIIAIQWRGMPITISIKLYDTLGKVIKSTTLLNPNIKIDISNLSNGLYFVQLSAKNKTVIKKLIINH